MPSYPPTCKIAEGNQSVLGAVREEAGTVPCRNQFHILVWFLERSKQMQERLHNLAVRTPWRSQWAVRNGQGGCEASCGTLRSFPLAVIARTVARKPPMLPAAKEAPSSFETSQFGQRLLTVSPLCTGSRLAYGGGVCESPACLTRQFGKLTWWGGGWTRWLYHLAKSEGRRLS